MSTDSQWSSGGNSLRAIVAAMWGACVGIYVTALVLLPGLHTLGSRFPGRRPDLPASDVLAWDGMTTGPQILQQRIYILTCLMCPLLAWLSLKLRSRIGGWTGFAAVVLFVPAITLVFGGMSVGAPRLDAFAATAVVLGMPFLPLEWLTKAACALAPWLKRPTAPVPAPEQEPAPAGEPVGENSRPLARRLALGLVLLGVLIVFFRPWNINHFADAMTCEHHISLYLVGPSLSLLRPGAVPALDFESHYGLGHVYVFSYFLGDNYHTTLSHYLSFMFFTLVFFSVSAYFVLSEFFRSDAVAFLATVLLLAVSMEGHTYHHPSNWPIRFPFLFLFIGCAARAEWLGRSWLPVLGAGLFAGLSFFWQTDVGLSLGATGVVYYLALSVRERGGWGRMPLFLLASAAAFVVLTFMAFGPRTLSVDFYRHLLDPLVAFGAGIGFVPMKWQAGWLYLYNVIAPIVTLATLGFAVKRFRADPQQKLEAGYLFLLGTSGFIMVFKWVNRAIDPVWSINAVGIVVVMFWWLRNVTHILGEFLEARTGSQLFGKRVLHVRTLTGCAVAIGLFTSGLIASYFHDPIAACGVSSSPMVRLKTFTSRTPTLAHLALRKICNLTAEPVVWSPVDRRDIEFIRTHTAATESVTLIAEFDWVYLAEARRAPAFASLPVNYTYTYSLLERADKAMRESECVFVERECLKKFATDYPTLNGRLSPILTEDFTLVESGKALDLYRRKATSVTGTRGKSAAQSPGS
jgi:hypothetical protein